jgi:hypothetical protein
MHYGGAAVFACASTTAYPLHFFQVAVSSEYLLQHDRKRISSWLSISTVETTQFLCDR